MPHNNTIAQASAGTAGNQTARALLPLYPLQHASKTLSPTAHNVKPNPDRYDPYSCGPDHKHTCMQSKQHDCILKVVWLSQHAQLAATVVQYHNPSLDCRQAQQHHSTESCRSLQQLCLKITPNLDATRLERHTHSLMQLVQGACAAHTVAPTTSGFVLWHATTGPPAAHA